MCWAIYANRYLVNNMAENILVRNSPLVTWILLYGKGYIFLRKYLCENRKVINKERRPEWLV